MIYLDSAATTPIDPQVLDAMLPYLRENYGNPGSTHSLGRESRKAVDKAREQVAELLGCYPSEIVFTSGGTEANNLAIMGISKVLDRRRMSHIVTMMTEHDSVLRPTAHLRETGFHITYIDTDENGYINLDTLEKSVQPNTGLVCIMAENNETGIRNPIEKIADILLDAHSNPYFHCDCVQAVTNTVLNVKDMMVDTASISSHKINGPKGVGALYVRGLNESCELQPIMFGGGQEFGMRSGTENVAGIVGFGRACELRKEKRLVENIVADQFRAYFHRCLEGFLHDEGLTDLYHVNASEGKVANIRFDSIDAETLILAMDARGVCVSAGAACHGRSSEPSRTLIALGLSADEARNSVRFSFSSDNKREDVQMAAKITAECVKLLYGGI